LPLFRSVAEQWEIGHAGLSKATAKLFRAAADQSQSGTVAPGRAIGCPKQLHSGYVEVRNSFQRNRDFPANGQCLEQECPEFDGGRNIDRSLKPNQAPAPSLLEKCSHLLLLTPTRFSYPPIKTRLLEYLQT
jgi:hypothetical protein